MSIANLNNSIATLATNVNALIAAEAGAAPQAQVDAAQAQVDALNTAVVTALATPKN